MPKRPKKPCAYPSCPRLTDERYCEKHKKLAVKQYDKYGRSPEVKKRYGWQWQKVRRAFLAKHPLCEMCEKEHRLTKATEVHHILPLAAGGTSDEDNLMPLCKVCHSRITAKTGGRWSRGGGRSNLQKPAKLDRA